MNKKNKEIPVPDPNADRLKYNFPSASWGDMTGLIPYSADTEGERESYNDVYPYLPGEQKGQNELTE